MKFISMYLMLLVFFSCSDTTSNPTDRTQDEEIIACTDYLSGAINNRKDKRLQTKEGIREKCQAIIESDFCPSCKLPNGQNTKLKFYSGRGALNREIIAYDDELTMFFGVGVFQKMSSPSDINTKRHLFEIKPNNNSKEVKELLTTYKDSMYLYNFYPNPYKYNDLIFDENSIIFYLKTKLKGQQITLEKLKPIYADFIYIMNYLGRNDKYNSSNIQYKEIPIKEFLEYIASCDCSNQRICCEAENLLYNIFPREYWFKNPPVVYKANNTNKFIVFNLHELTQGVLVRSASKFEIITLFENGMAFH